MDICYYAYIADFGGHSNGVQSGVECKYVLHDIAALTSVQGLARVGVA